MANAQTYKVTVTTDGSGDATEYLPGDSGTLTGRVISISYSKSDFSDGVDFTITAEASTGSTLANGNVQGAALAKNLWVESNVNASKTVYPGVEMHDTTGTAQGVYDYPWLINQRIKIVVSSGGSAKVGYFLCEIA